MFANLPVHQNLESFEPLDRPKASAMPDIVLIGLNHKSAPIEVRECIAFSKQESGEVLEAFRNYPQVKEVLLISTCNRVELILVSKDTPLAIAAAKTCISEFRHIPVKQFEPFLYVYNGDEAVRHVFRVASSLDSMIVGEPQILGQIKAAYAEAVHKKTSGVILNKLLHKTFFVAKRIRTETGIGDHAVSISYAAIELAKKIFGELEGKKVLLIGAGEMAELAVEHLIRNRSGDIWVANRTFERGVELAQRFNGNPIRFEEITDALQAVDIVISSTGSPDVVIRREQVKGVMRSRKNRPIFFIDIAVPRDIDPDINNISNAYVYDIDDLKGVIEENIEDRNREAIKGERIIDEAVIRFRQWYDTLNAVPTIVAIRHKMEGIAEAELKKTLHSLPHLTGKDEEAIRRMIHAIFNKILHDPTQLLKGNGCHGGSSSAYLEAARKLFKLDPENGK